jgi:hypothetical protein
MRLLRFAALAAIAAVCLAVPVHSQAPAKFHYHETAVLPDPHENPGKPDPRSLIALPGGFQRPVFSSASYAMNSGFREPRRCA